MLLGERKTYRTADTTVSPPLSALANRILGPTWPSVRCHRKLIAKSKGFPGLEMNAHEVDRAKTAC